MSRRTAVDSKAKAYWTEYFGDYGKIWTEGVARRVAASLSGSITKTAAKGGQEVRVLRSQVVPPTAKSWAETETGGLVFEAFYRGLIERQGRRETVMKGFVAEFDARGKMLALRTKAI